MSDLTDAGHDQVENAQIVLETLGMDAERSNERSALVLLALAGLTPSETWGHAANPMLGTRAIMDFIRDEYGKEYAPNTRETVRALLSTSSSKLSSSFKTLTNRHAR